MPSRRPRSATRNTLAGQVRSTASRIAQPATARSARPGPMQGCAARAAFVMPRSCPATRPMAPRSSTSPSIRRRSYRRSSRCTAASVVIVPEVPTSCTGGPPEARGIPRTSSPIAAHTCRTMLSNVEASGSEVNASERVTTPIGSDALVGLPASGPSSSSHRISVLPPPMSTNRAGPAPRSISGRQPNNAKRASCSWSRTSSSIPVARRTRARNSGPFPARRQASVATQRASLTPCRADDPCAHPKRRNGPRHCPFAEPAARGQAFAEAHDPRKAVDHFEAVGVRCGNQQTTVVGPKVERSERRRAPPWDR